MQKIDFEKFDFKLSDGTRIQLVSMINRFLKVILEKVPTVPFYQQCRLHIYTMFSAVSSVFFQELTFSEFNQL